MRTPSLHEADALWTLSPETRKRLAKLGMHHHGWYHDHGRWQQSIATQDFIPIDPTLIALEACYVLRHGGHHVMECTLSLGPDPSCHISLAARTLSTRGSSPTAVALYMLKKAEDLVAGVEVDEGPSTISNSDSPKNLKSDS
jgi:hypothetical protein